MTPFKTNKKDRALFAEFLNLEEVPSLCGMYPAGDSCSEMVLKTPKNSKSYFVNDGFQWVISELVRREIYPEFLKGELDLYTKAPTTHAHGNSVGEQLFRAVVALARAGK